MKNNIIHPVINKFLNYIREVRRYSDHTIRSYTLDLDEYDSFCKNYDSNVEFYKHDHRMIQNFLQHLSKKNKNVKTLSRKLAAIKSLYNYMMSNNIVKINSAKFIKSPKLDKKLPHYLSLKEAADLIRIPYGDDKKSIRDKLILELFYATGIRISELVNIRYSALNIEQGTIQVTGKGDKERTVIIGRETQLLIKKYISFNDKICLNKNNFLFPSHKGSNLIYDKHLSTRTIFNIVKKYLKIISNNEKLSPHSLRHTFATHMLEKGADLLSIKELLGHNSLSSTQIYTHIQPAKLKKIYNQSHPYANNKKEENE